jgi:hypothetical protein
VTLGKVCGLSVPQFPISTGEIIYLMGLGKIKLGNSNKVLSIGADDLAKSG